MWTFLRWNGHIVVPSICFSLPSRVIYISSCTISIKWYLLLQTVKVLNVVKVLNYLKKNPWYCSPFRFLTKCTRNTYWRKLNTQRIVSGTKHFLILQRELLEFAETGNVFLTLFSFTFYIFWSIFLHIFISGFGVFYIFLVTFIIKLFILFYQYYLFSINNVIYWI